MSECREDIPISKWPCNVLFFYINTIKIPNLFTLIGFCFERHNLLCSHGSRVLCECHVLTRDLRMDPDNMAVHYKPMCAHVITII